MLWSNSVGKLFTNSVGKLFKHVTIPVCVVLGAYKLVKDGSRNANMLYQGFSTDEVYKKRFARLSAAFN